MSCHRVYGECPVCCCEYDSADQAELYFCPCLYQVCAFCHAQLECCPSCRKQYDKQYKLIIQNPIFHMIPDQLFNLRVINRKIARISPELLNKNEQFKQFGNIKSIKQLKNATVVEFETEEQAEDCIRTINQCRINNSVYEASYASCTFCRTVYSSQECKNEDCPNIHVWDPKMKYYQKEDKHQIALAAKYYQHGLIEKYDEVPPSYQKIELKQEEIKQIPEQLRLVLARWAEELL